MNPAWFILPILIGGCLGVKTSSKDWHNSFEDEAFSDLSELEESLASCAQSCLMDLFTKGNEIRTLKDPGEKFRRLCLMYNNASSCIANERVCPDGELLKLALGGLDELCNKRRAELEPHIPCLEKNTENFLTSCDSSCGLSNSMRILMKNPYVKNVSAPKHIKYFHKELDQVCNTTACLTACLAGGLNSECGKPSGSIIVEALLRPLISVSSILDELGWHTKMNALMEVPPMCRNFVEKRKLKEIINGNHPEKWRKAESHVVSNSLVEEWRTKAAGESENLGPKEKSLSGKVPGARLGRSTSHSRESRERNRNSIQKANSHENRGRGYTMRPGPSPTSRPKLISAPAKGSGSHEKRTIRPEPHNRSSKTTLPMQRKEWNSNSRESEEKLRRVRPRQANQPPSPGQPGGPSIMQPQPPVGTSSRSRQSSSGSRERPMSNRPPASQQPSRPAPQPGAPPRSAYQPPRPGPQPTPPPGPAQHPPRPAPQPTPPPRPAYQPAKPIPHPAKPGSPVPQPTSPPKPAPQSGPHAGPSVSPPLMQSPTQLSSVGTLVPKRQPAKSGPKQNSRESEETGERLRKVHARQAGQPSSTTIFVLPNQPRPSGPPGSGPNSRGSGERDNRPRPNQPGPPMQQQPPARPPQPQPPQRPGPKPGSSGSWEWPGNNRPRPTQRPPWRPTSPPPPPLPPRPTSPPWPQSPPIAPPRPPSPPRPTFVPPPPPRPTSPPPPPPPPSPPSPWSSQPWAEPPRPGWRYRWRRIRSADTGERYRWRSQERRQARSSSDERERYRWRRTRNLDNPSKNERYRWRRVL